MPVVTYKLTPPLATKFLNFENIVYDLDWDEFLTNPLYHANVITLRFLIDTTSI